ncbi:MAG TPA: transglycosylase domain-containing protein [Deltaproteobacteria bacterium]|nr:transglycosylase domain-containing protein [Deltaproteobacteria bacterium]HRW81195.1 transglycosylase domain-containing protein [Desulfomonilia bacterium]HNS88668.1 transglycosylase domain-containing protein [Deltaproteobacteria bacterium]HOC74907.1 transglycosylase domain-containing protein [Deltaproteobacteria bacterium]HON95578.1 transglycosylase domain-containing protein [Deltaproteobacteria bacterium]
MSRIRRFIAWGVGILLVAGMLALAFFGMNAYREMRKLQTGTLWHLPTRIYSSPFEIAPGVDMSRSGLMDRLSRLRYRKVDTVTEPGQFRLAGGTLTVYLHRFEYPDGTGRAGRVELVLDGNRVKKILSGHARQVVPSVRLEPETIATLYDAGFEDREVVSLAECPPHLIDALLCVEDRRFFEHVGIDLRAMGRALVADVFRSKVVEGGSTITQQLVKNLFLTHARTVNRKLREVWLALIMEAAYTKDEILGMYINEIYLGRSGYAGIHGFGRASRLFFDDDVSGLDVHEAALLVGIIRSPNRYSPYTHPKAALERRNTVLALMLEQGKLTPEAYRSAVKKPLGVVAFTPVVKRAPYFVDYALSSARDLYPGEDLLSRGGLRIFTTLDPQVQRVAEEASSKGLLRFPASVQTASVVLRPATGEVLAMVGGRDYGASQFNRAVSLRRNIGSLIKPVVYCTALEHGYTLASLLEDRPLTVTLPGKSTWSPANHDGESHGDVLLIDALVNSYNQATVRLGLDLGLETASAGVKEVLPGTVVPRSPALLLGAVACSPLDVAVMYAAFANRGNRPSPRCLDAVGDEHGAVIWKAPAGPVLRVFDEGPAYLVDTALREVLRRGTARGAASYGVPDGVCGKTGTTDDLRDSWFAAYTKDLVAVVWVGDDAFRSTGLTGAAGALPVAGRIMARLAVPVQGDAPEGITFCDVDPATGRRASLWTASPVTLPFLAGTEPARGPADVLPGIWDALKSFWPFKD